MVLASLCIQWKVVIGQSYLADLVEYRKMYFQKAYILGYLGFSTQSFMISDHVHERFPHQQDPRIYKWLTSH
uniref:Putative secreted protein n=1 Tax=Panstrongylus lignarius TaxID=156445 RepID=A0A224Y4J8_9HEMI